MDTTTRLLAITSALLCLMGVILGALGSHLVEMDGLLSVWESATDMHLFNAAALVGLTALYANRGSGMLKWGAWIIVLGTVLFSGGIYLHIISGFKVPNLAPTGGITLMVGWLLAILSFLRRS